MAFESIKRVLPKVIAAHAIGRPLEVRRVKETAEGVLLARGAEIARFVRVVSFKDGTLKMEALAPAAKQFLHMETPRLVNEMNRALGGKIVLRLDVSGRGF